MKRLFDASLTYMKAESLVTDPRCIRFILMTTYAMGLRISETLAIRFKHIDRKQQIIHIEDSKFFKSRYVTYNHQVARLIDEVFEWRKSDSYPMEPDNYVFVSKLGKPVNFVTLHCIFAKIRKKANLYFPELKDINQEYMTSGTVSQQTFLRVGIKKEKTYRPCFRNSPYIWIIQM